MRAAEELAARAYDRAAIHKASMEGGVIVTNQDISQYRGEIEKLQSMTRKELLSMIADEKKTAAMVGGVALAMIDMKKKLLTPINFIQIPSLKTFG